MIDVNDLRKGVTFELDGQLLRVIEYHHHKPGRGNAVIRTKVRNLRTGAQFEKTFQSGDRVQNVRVEAREMQYLYHDGDLYTFMDGRTYEQVMLDALVKSRINCILSFPRKRESSKINKFWTPAFAGVTTMGPSYECIKVRANLELTLCFH